MTWAKVITEGGMRHGDGVRSRRPRSVSREGIAARDARKGIAARDARKGMGDM